MSLTQEQKQNLEKICRNLLAGGESHTIMKVIKFGILIKLLQELHLYYRNSSPLIAYSSRIRGRARLQCVTQSLALSSWRNWNRLNRNFILSLSLSLLTFREFRLRRGPRARWEKNPKIFLIRGSKPVHAPSVCFFACFFFLLLQHILLESSRYPRRNWELESERESDSVTTHRRITKRVSRWYQRCGYNVSEREKSRANKLNML